MILRTLLLLSVSATALASAGDRSTEFQTCLILCREMECSKGNTLPMALQLTQWTCEDDCKYNCMHSATDRAEAAGAPIFQYYGKWPFWRFAGMQEPASVAFSLLNLYAHYHGYQRLRKEIPRRHPMRRYYTLWSLLNLNAWVWSSVFHTRDTPITEKLDYFSAGLAILYSLCYAVIRLFHLYAPRHSLRLSSDSGPSIWLKPWMALCAILYLCHIAYLTLSRRFDYTYNMAANLVVGLVHNFLWLWFAMPSSSLQSFPPRNLKENLPYAFKAVIFVVATTAATSLELFDFPPFRRTIDAHSLWHLSTVPIIPFWYSFLIEDSAYDAWRSVQ